MWAVICNLEIRDLYTSPLEVVAAAFNDPEKAVQRGKRLLSGHGASIVQSDEKIDVAIEIEMRPRLGDGEDDVVVRLVHSRGHIGAHTAGHSEPVSGSSDGLDFSHLSCS